MDVYRSTSRSVLATGSATELNPIMQRPSSLLLRTPIVVGSQQAVATSTRSQAAVTLQVLPSNSPQSAKAVEEVGYIIALFPGFRLGPKEPTLFVTHLLGFDFSSCLPCRQQAIHIK